MELLVKVGSKYPDINDPLHYSQWRDGQIIDIREDGFFKDKMSRIHHCVIRFPNIDYWDMRGSRNWKFCGEKNLKLKELVSTPEINGKYIWELPEKYERSEKPNLKRRYFIDFLWLLENKYIDLSTYESIYDKSRQHLPIVIYANLNSVLRIEKTHARLSTEKDQSRGTISFGTYTIGATGDYAIITSAEADIAAALTGNLTFEHLNEETSVTSDVTFDINTNSYLFKLTAISGARHDGGEYGNGARINLSSYIDLKFDESTDGTFDDLEISNLSIDASGTNNGNIQLIDGANNGIWQIFGCLIKGDSGTYYGIITLSSVKNYNIYNNIIYGISNSYAGNGIDLSCYNCSNINIYNNTIIKCNNNCYQNAAAIGYTILNLKNNIAQGGTSSDFKNDGGGFGTTAKNISEDGTSPDVSYKNINLHDGNSCFVDYANNDYRLDSGGDEISTLAEGEDLSGTFTDDIVGATRSVWYIGAYEISSLPVLVSPGNVDCIVKSINPTALLGYLVLQDLISNGILSIENPNIVLGSINIPNVIANSIIKSVSPTIKLSEIDIYEIVVYVVNSLNINCNVLQLKEISANILQKLNKNVKIL